MRKSIKTFLATLFLLIVLSVQSWASFPVVEDVTQTLSGTNTTSHTVNLPATVNSGDLLIMVCRVGGTINSNPSGWTVFVSHTANPVYALIADGTEDGGTATVGTSSANLGAFRVIRISNHGVDLVGDYGMAQVSTSGTSTSADPPSLNPVDWDVLDTLWIAANVTSNSGQTITGYPSGYTNTGYSITGFTGVATAFKNSAAASEDPGAFTLGFSGAWLARTIAISPVITGADRRWW